MTASLLLRYSQAFVPSLIAIVVAYIAYQQWHTNALKSKLDLFDRRFRVFLEVRKVLSSVVPEGRATKEDFLKFRTGVAESYFIFGPEIEKYLDEIYLHGNKLATADYRYRLPKEERAEDYDPKKGAEEMNTHLT
jgi:hypothetical protein